MAEAYIRQHLSRYRHKDLIKSAMLSTQRAFPDMRAKYDTFEFSDNTSKDLLCLDGTIPVNFKGGMYNIPICIWLFETFPYNSPMCYVKCTPDMMIKPSRHVDRSGRVYLPFLHEWKHPNSDLIGLIQVMTIVFGENSPVFARPANLSPTVFSVQSPNLKAQSSPPYTPTDYSSPDPDDFDQAKTIIRNLKREMIRKEEDWVNQRQTLKNKITDLEGLKNQSTTKLDELEETLQKEKTYSTKTIKVYMDVLEQTKQELHQAKTQRTQSMQQAEQLEKELDDTNQTLQKVMLSHKQSNEEVDVLSRELARLTRELEEANKTLESSTKGSAETAYLLTRKLDQTQLLLQKSRTKATQEIRKLTEELDKTRNLLKLATTESSEEIKTLNEQLKSTKLTLTNTTTQADKDIERLTKELEQTQKTLQVSTKDSSKDSERLTRKLEHTQFLLEESRTQLTKEFENLQNTLQQSTKEIETLTGQLENTKLELENTKTQLNQETEQLSKQLLKSGKNFNSSIKVLENENETLSKELLQTKMRWLEAERESTEEAKRLTLELEKSCNALQLTKTESAQKIKALQDQLEYANYTVNDTKTPLSEELQRLTIEFEHEKQALMKSNAESRKTIEELRENVMKFKQKTENSEINKIQLVNKIEIINKELALTKQTLQQITFDRDVTRNELTQYQLNFAKESRALKEVLNQTKQAIADVQKRTAEEKSVELETTPYCNLKQTEESDVPIYAAIHVYTGGGAPAECVPGGLGVCNQHTLKIQRFEQFNCPSSTEFGRLIVGIADSLTLDQSLQLTMLFNLPPSMSDALCRVSLYQSPGMKFLEEIRNRNIINMYDVTNLQKAFAVLKMENVKQNLLEPYQQQVLEELYDLHKAEEMLTWEDVETLNAQKNKTVEVLKEDIRIPSDKDSVEELDESTKAESMTKKSENKADARVPTLGDRHHHSVYIEHNIGKEGGTILLSGASLIISAGALLESHVIGISIINKPPFPLPREVDKARMTPLIKLEPLGLVLKKPVQLTIPHSALIPEPKGVDVIIYSGQMSSNTEGFSDGITWTVERSLSRQLKERTITVDIQSLSYLSASLLSESMEPSIHIVRAVPFLDVVRNDDDDIIVTVCFCADNELEYNMLMLDYQTKLPLEQYSTLHLCRHSGISNRDKDMLSLTISSRNDSYVPDMTQQVKDIAVAHLFAASRVSHQFRLKKNHQTNSDAVDLMLTVTQAKNKLTEIFLKTRLKDLMVSQKSEDLRSGLASPAVHAYENLKLNISSMLEKFHCRMLATYFELSPAEIDRVENDSFPGRMVIKILDEREMIMPQKVIDLFQGLKACHLEKTARLVSEYIDLNSQQSQKTQENQTETVKVIPKELQRPIQKQQIRAHSSQSDQSAQTMLSSSCITCHHHVETLTYEGYAEKEVVGALDFSQNKLDLARKVLQYVRDQVLLPKQDILFYKEQYIDENGGEITLREANVDLLIPVGAVSKGCIVSIGMMTSQHVTVPFEGRAPQLAPVINCGQQSIELNKPITLRIPHCASEKEGITSIEMFCGRSSIEGGIQWRERRQHEPTPLLKKDHFELLAQNFGTIGVYVTADYNKRLGKRFRVLPLISRIANPSEDLTVTLWIYNDDETEHMYLLHEEIAVGGKIQLHDFKRFTLKAPGNDKEVHIKSGHNKISPYPNANMKKFMSTVLWNKTRQKAEFYFQNKEGISDIAFKLRLCKAQFLRTSDDLHFDLKITMPELLQEPRGLSSALLKMHKPHAAMKKSFHELISNMSAEIGLDSCWEIAGIFRLSSTCKDKLKESSEPGNVLFEELIHEQLISATAVSALDVALTTTGNVRLAEDVREYRRRNTTFATTISSLF